MKRRAVMVVAILTLLCGCSATDVPSAGTASRPPASPRQPLAGGGIRGIGIGVDVPDGVASEEFGIQAGWVWVFSPANPPVFDDFHALPYDGGQASEPLDIVEILNGVWETAADRPVMLCLGPDPGQSRDQPAMVTCPVDGDGPVIVDPPATVGFTGGEGGTGLVVVAGQSTSDHGTDASD